MAILAETLMGLVVATILPSAQICSLDERQLTPGVRTTQPDISKELKTIDIDRRGFYS